LKKILSKSNIINLKQNIHSESRNEKRQNQIKKDEKKTKEIVGLTIDSKQKRPEINLILKKTKNLSLNKLPFIGGLSTKHLSEGLSKTFICSPGLSLNNVNKITIAKIKKKNSEKIDFSKNNKNVLL